MKKSSVFLVVVALVGVLVTLLLAGRRGVTPLRGRGAEEVGEAPRREPAHATSAIAETKAVADSDAAVESGDAAPAGDESPEDAEERLVDAFDALTDKWMEPSAKGVTMADVDAFVRQFAAVPKARKEECLQRALNLIPDENVMLLAGVLMDKSQDREFVELVFNDVLNRDEDVKKPILRQIFQDKAHPCWADVAWILDVTGETPKK